MNNLDADGYEITPGGWLKMYRYASELSEEDREKRNRLGRRNTIGCRICGDSYVWKEPHCVKIDQSSGIMACCEECWEKGDKQEITQCVSSIVHSWPSDHDKLPSIISAVERDLCT